ncbi:tetratricopeptide repeat protein [Neobacillus sp. YIM B06451]|uniref:tetratricopeptide repeat protein n=1 Tax=Neobacillus sp. YIM B06451 TaxID=3070994 RepID=UPI00292F3113|nr:tetratricopeptide repeat protein [Neobacillus sp. YIM B06451]
MELNDELYEEISNLCSDGDSLVEESMYDKAIDLYLKALNLVPAPKTDWEASTWIYTALGDTCFIKGDYKAAKNYLFDALNCPDGIGNPFILLRLGETLFEMQEVIKAKEYLLRAYMLEGYDIFEEEDGKYFDLIKNET